MKAAYLNLKSTQQIIMYIMTIVIYMIYEFYSVLLDKEATKL